MHSSSSSVSSKAGQRGSKTGMHGGGSAHNRPLKISTALATNSGPLPQHGVSASAAATGGNSSSTTSNSTKSASAGNLLSTGQPYTANGPSSGQPPSAFPPPAMSRQAFLGVFEAMYDQHETQLRLQATLKDQIRKSSTLLQTLQSSGQMIEGLVRLHFREMQVVYGEKFGTALTDLNRRLVGIENRLGIHASGSGGGGGAGAGSVGAVEDSANAGGTGVEDSTNAGDLDEGESAAGGGLTSMATSKGGDAADDDGRGAHARGGLDAELDGLRSRVDAAERQARSFVPSD
ncbi:hypothetical protein BC831DRAFT_473959 [Entophlyctis helioformis]|nr:hypothetical protein BC831DRAFT_473959 [Entophlyctis helioformis]